MTTLKAEDKYQDIRGSSLSAREPYHVPGYAGHKHQYKYQCGHTFGVTTHRLLQSAKPSSRDPNLLRPVDPPRAHTVALGFHDVPKLERDDYDIKMYLKERRDDIGDQIYQPMMNSGYMGFVPKAHFSSYNGKGFPHICDDALRDFSVDQRRHEDSQRQMRATMRAQYGDMPGGRESLSLKTQLPLRIRNRTVPPFMSESACKPHASPYFLPPAHPQKYFKSGYAGHVPFYKDLAGNSYPAVTNEALRIFSDDMKRFKENKGKELERDIINANRCLKAPGEKPKVYLVESGMLPRYAGHIPGQKFRFGHTFTHLSINPRKNSEPGAVKISS